MKSTYKKACAPIYSALHPHHIHFVNEHYPYDIKFGHNKILKSTSYMLPVMDGFIVCTLGRKLLVLELRHFVRHFMIFVHTMCNVQIMKSYRLLHKVSSQGISRISCVSLVEPTILATMRDPRKVGMKCLSTTFNPNKMTPAKRIYILSTSMTVDFNLRRVKITRIKTENSP